MKKLLFSLIALILFLVPISKSHAGFGIFADVPIAQIPIADLGIGIFIVEIVIGDSACCLPNDTCITVDFLDMTACAEAGGGFLMKLIRVSRILVYPRLM